MARLKQGRTDYASCSNEPTSRMRSAQPPLRIAVIGGGLAGLTAALALGERGQHVTLIERNSYLGGKVGSWQVSLPNGEKMNISHGFHAFFSQYYNLRSVLSRLEANQYLKKISDYLIICDANRYSFRRVSKVPLFNILSMIKNGFFKVGIFFKPESWRLLAMLAYDHHKTFKKWDRLSFDDFANKAKLTRDFRLVMNNICRAYFSAEKEISTAEIIKASHTYFFSNSLGLVYDYMDDDYQRTMINPFETALLKNGVRITKNRQVKNLECIDGKFQVDKEEYDRVIIACDIKNCRRLILNSNSIQNGDPLLSESMMRMQVCRPYSVVRLWLDSDPFEENLPVFIFLKRIQYLDSLTLVHRAERESSTWSELNHGAVIELHCYGIDDSNLPSLDEVTAQIINELYSYFPATKTCTIVHQEVQLRDDFPSYLPGQNSSRPASSTTIKGLNIAGDWVKLPVPAMLMEAACTSGLLAANNIIIELGMTPEKIETVPLKGLLAW